ncbi:MAG: S8 family serine peptidase [Acidilobaceae archaeon]|nr:S8 family serine peptidase [Acidilobaceae archaeon]
MLRTFMGALVLLMMLLSTFPVHAFSKSPKGEEAEFLVFGPYPSSKESMESLKSAVRSAGGAVLEEFPLLGGVLIRASQEAVRRLSSLGYEVYINSQLQLIEPREEPTASLEPMVRVSVPSIGAPSAWAMGLNGSGVRVAVIDTGIFDSHPWFMRGGRSIVVWEYNATDAREVDYCGKGTADASDHGTHVAGIIASQNVTSRGVAPGVVLYDIIVFARPCRTTTDAIIARGVERALLGPDNQPGSGDEPHIITMSLGAVVHPSTQYAIYVGAVPKPAVIEVLERAASRAVVTVAAGNNYGINYFNYLCLASGVICVGATDDRRTLTAADDRMASFSSRGPGLPGMMVPLVSAPGVSIVSASVPERAAGRVPTRALSGTSMATPHAAGAAAIIIQQFLSQGRPLDPAEVAKALAHTARDVLVGNYNPGLTVSTITDHGAGQINLTAAVSRLVSMDSGGRPFVHMFSPVPSGSFSFRVINIAGSAVDLEVSIVARYEYDPDLVNLTDRFSVSHSRLSLPPGGSASITVSFRDLPPGVAGGYVVLRGHGITHRFPFLITVPVDVRPDLPWNGGIAVMRLNSRDNVYDHPVLFVNVRSAAIEPLFVVLQTGGGTVFTISESRIVLTSPTFLNSAGRVHYVSEQGLYMLTLNPSGSITTPVGIAIVVGSVTSNIERLDMAVEELRGSVWILEITASFLRYSLEVLRQELQSSTSRLEQMIRQESEQRKAEIERLERAISGVQSSLSSLEQSVRSLAQQLQSEVEARKREIARLDEAINSLAQQLQSEVEARKREIARLEESIRNLQQSVQSLERSLSILRMELQREIAARRAEIERLEQLLRQESEARRAEDARLERLIVSESEDRKAEIRRLNQSIGLLERALRAVEEAVRALRGDLQRESEARRAEDARLERLIVSEAEARRAEIARLEGALRGVQQAVASLEGSLRALRVSLESLERRAVLMNESLRAAIRAEAERISRLEAEARALRASIEAASRELSERLSALNRELERRSAELSRQIEATSSELERELGERASEIQSLRQEHDTTRAISLGSTLLALIALLLAAYQVFLRRF